GQTADQLGGDVLTVGGAPAVAAQQDPAAAAQRYDDGVGRAHHLVRAGVEAAALHRQAVLKVAAGVLEVCRLDLQPRELLAEKVIGFGQALRRPDVDERTRADDPADPGSGQPGKDLALEAHGAARPDGLGDDALHQVHTAADQRRSRP